jgi:hypothetical protein
MVSTCSTRPRRRVRLSHGRSREAAALPIRKIGLIWARRMSTFGNEWNNSSKKAYHLPITCFISCSQRTAIFSLTLSS